MESHTEEKQRLFYVKGISFYHFALLMHNICKQIYPWV